MFFRLSLECRDRVRSYYFFSLSMILKVQSNWITNWTFRSTWTFSELNVLLLGGLKLKFLPLNIHVLDKKYSRSEKALQSSCFECKLFTKRLIIIIVHYISENTFKMNRENNPRHVGSSPEFQVISNIKRMRNPVTLELYKFALVWPGETGLGNTIQFYVIRVLMRKQIILLKGPSDHAI